MENELDSLDKRKVWEIVQKPAKSKLIKTKWVYSLKQDDAGKNIKYKARLVAAGFNQIKNIDYSESYSPVVNIESFRLLIALAAKLKLNVNFFDAKTAYLYGDLEETVYVLPPPGYEKLIGDDKVCKLKKSIYGLPQSGRNWMDDTLRLTICGITCKRWPVTHQMGSMGGQLRDSGVRKPLGTLQGHANIATGSTMFTYRWTGTAACTWQQVERETIERKGSGNDGGEKSSERERREGDEKSRGREK
ncbi:retrovirus-related Pol polyprotein from transposon TNT 1-94 [Trichonephila clavipes]|nr:retrovirus-related Pol polyprotein from transposon TNT 1-94 [Trichonephila clavipes]